MSEVAKNELGKVWSILTVKKGMSVKSELWRVMDSGYRARLCKQAGLPLELAEAPLRDLSDSQREKLYEANEEIRRLTEHAMSALVGTFVR